MALTISKRRVTLADGTTLDLLVHELPGGEDPQILVRTRTGTKIHRGWGGSSKTDCGVWLRTNGSRFAVPAARCVRENLCESCFPQAAAPEPLRAESGAELTGQTNDLTGRETVLHEWAPRDGTLSDDVAAWRVRQDEYGYWLDRRGEGMRAWGIERKLTKAEATGLIAQVQRTERNGTVAADNATTNEEDSMSKTTTAPEKAPSAAAPVAEEKQETAAPAVDSDALLKTVTDRATKALRDVEIHTPKSGGYVTVRVSKQPIAHLSPRKKSLLLEVALAPSSVGGGAEADPRRDGWARLAVTDAKGADRAYNAIEKAAGKLAEKAAAK